MRTCAEAAKERGIPLKMELKTLFLCADDLLIAAHLRGCDRLNNRSIKRLFKVRNLTFASPNFIRSLGLEMGRINPWSVPDHAKHIVDTAVLEEDSMATNNGTLTGTTLVDIKSFLNQPSIQVHTIRVIV